MLLCRKIGTHLLRLTLSWNPRWWRGQGQKNNLIGNCRSLAWCGRLGVNVTSEATYACINGGPLGIPQRCPVLNTFFSQIGEHWIPDQTERKNYWIGGRGYGPKIKCKRHYWCVSEEKMNEAKPDVGWHNIRRNWTVFCIFSIIQWSINKKSIFQLIESTGLPRQICRLDIRTSFQDSCQTPCNLLTGSQSRRFHPPPYLCSRWETKLVFFVLDGISSSQIEYVWYSKWSHPMNSKIQIL